jgi:hypothetical protein
MVWQASTDDEARGNLGEQYKRDMEQLWQFLADDLRRIARKFAHGETASNIESIALTMFTNIIFVLPQLKIDPSRNVRGLLVKVASGSLSDNRRRRYENSSSSQASKIVPYDEQQNVVDADNSNIEKNSLDKIDHTNILEAATAYWLSHLDTENRKIMSLRWLSDPPMSFREIARQLGPGWREDDVRMCHHRIMNETRKYLREQGLLEDETQP